MLATKNSCRPLLLKLGDFRRTQGVGDLFQIHSLCMRDGNDFNLAYIPADFREEPSEVFDPVYMKVLFEHGFEMARNGHDWKKSPPSYQLPE